MLELIIAGISLLIALVIAIGFFYLYNKFQILKNGAEAGLSQIKVALKKRLDLITQLVDVVKSYAKYEREVLTKITTMRKHLTTTDSSEKLQDIEHQSKGVLNKLLAVVENYPDLKSSDTVMKLMDTIKEVEEEISRQRYTYNNIVQDYNTRFDSFPSLLIARLFSYAKLNYLQFVDDNGKKPNTRWNP